MPIPFGYTLQLWRLHQGLTQEQLAQAAHLPRPNLSAIERGRREVTLSTLRALAVALDVNPGLLADGIVPGGGTTTHPLSRSALERIADAVVSRTDLQSPQEQTLVRWLQDIMSQRTRLAFGRRGNSRRSARLSTRAWLSLRTSYSPEILRTLFQRIEHRQRFHEPQTD